jgi:hypothetical protein
MPNQDRRHPVAVSGRVAAEQQERSNLSQPNVTETEAVDRGGLGELLVERDRGVEVVHEDPGYHTGDVGHTQGNSHGAVRMP